MKKRLLSLALALVMVCGLLPTAAMAATVTEIVPCKYDEVRDFSEGLAAVRVGDYRTGKWGFVDATGKEVVPCKYSEVSYAGFSDGLAAVRDENHKWGFIDTTGKEVVPCKYDIVYDFSEGLAAVRDGDYKWGVIDKTGKETIPLQYGEVGKFSEGLAEVQLITDWVGSPERYPIFKCGFVDATGKEVVPTKYDKVNTFSEGMAAVELDDKWGFIDTTGKEVVPCRYDRVDDFSDGLAAVRVGEYPNDKWGCIDKTGKEVVPCKYGYVDSFSEGLAAVELNGKHGFIDKTGKEVIPCTLDCEVGDFHEGFAVTIEYASAIQGFIDKTGKVIVPLGEYVGAHDFSEGLAVLVEYSTGKSGFVDATGKAAIPFQYDDAGDFDQGLAAVELNGKWGLIDKTGKEVVSCKYDEVSNFSEGLAAVQLDGKWGFLAIDGSTDTPSAPVATTAYASTQTVTVDGKPVTFYAYALKDANGNDTNYIKLRDVAQILNGSAAQFQVGWDGSITITTKTAYTPNGSEMVQNFTGNQSYTVSTNPVTVNGQPTNLEAITLTDASGGGYTYFKLRDLGAALGFNVTWNAQTGISIDPNSPYNANS